MTGKIAIIGNGDSVLAFKAGGVEAFPATDVEDARNILKRIAKTHSVIMLTDDLAKQMDDLIKRMLEKPYPVILTIPDKNGESTYAREKMKEEMDRALGVDVLFNNRDDK